MSINNPQMRTRSEGTGNTAQSPCTKSSAVSHQFKDIQTIGNALKVKSDGSVRLYFENVNGLSPELGYSKTSWKYGRLRHIFHRLQVDVLSLVETQLNLDLTTKTFSLRNKLFQNRTATVSIASHNTYELLGKRQQGGVLTGVMGSLTNAVVATGSDSTGLGRWN